MTIAFYMNTVTAHQLPLAREVVKIVGSENFRYIDFGYEGPDLQNRKVSEPWITRDRSWLETADVVLTGIRDIDLLERRAAKGLKTYLTAERWLKPYAVGFGKSRTARRFFLPGWVKLLSPGFRKVIKRLVKIANENECVKLLPIGPHAAADFSKLGVRADKLVPWGYFVAPSEVKVNAREKVKGGGEQPNLTSFVHLDLGSSPRNLKVLWAGRDIPLKHVDDIERAVALANKNLKSSVHLHLGSSPKISFTKLTGVSPTQVREAMRSHDTFVFASDSYEGWGAVVSEALEEGMNVICSSDCGSGAALLPRTRLFKCGDVGALAKLLEAEYRGELPQCSIGEWTAARAAERLVSL